MFQSPPTSPWFDVNIPISSSKMWRQMDSTDSSTSEGGVLGGNRRGKPPMSTMKINEIYRKTTENPMGPWVSRGFYCLYNQIIGVSRCFMMFLFVYSIKYRYVNNWGVPVIDRKIQLSQLQNDLRWKSDLQQKLVNTYFLEGMRSLCH